MTIVRGTQFLCFLLCVSSVVLKVLQDEMRDECIPKGFYLEDCKTYDCSTKDGKGKDLCCGDSCHGVDNNCCTWDTPCKENDGDCDKDIDCDGDLRCGSNNCPWGGWDDCCEKPGPDAPVKPATLQCDNSVVPKDPDCTADKEKYCKIAAGSRPGSENTLCKYCGVNEDKCGKKLCLIGITDPADKQVIVDRHNELRRKVAKGLETKGRAGKEGQPPAANMMEVEWDDEVAKMAQTWVNQCSGAHDKNRNMESGRCGQNNAWKGTWGPYGPVIDYPLTTLIDMWYDEVKDFDKDVIGTFGNGDHTGGVLHYTQFTWATVTKIGCGYQYGYDGRYFRATLTCNYCPGGNMYGDNMYKVGPAGSACPEGSTNNDGLCKLN